MKKIYLVSFNGIGKTGGVERVCYYLYKILSEKYEVYVIKAPNLPSKLRILMSPFIISCRILFIKNKFVISNSWQLFPYKSDISIHHGTTAGIMKYLGKNTIGSKLISFMEKLSAKNAKNVFAVSGNCSFELQKLYKIEKRKITVLPNFVDDELFSPEASIKINENIYVIFVGTLCERKGLSLLKQFSDYLESQDKIKLRIACNNADNTDLFLKNKNTEILVGLEISEMMDFYKKGDILYFPTKYEGFSMSTLEALSSGCPVIGSNFAITEELQKYKFCKVITDFSPKFVCSEIQKLVETYKFNKNEIHEEISKSFGKAQYRTRLLTYVEEKMGE